VFDVLPREGQNKRGLRPRVCLAHGLSLASQNTAYRDLSFWG
jgi:hypothetical protein